MATGDKLVNLDDLKAVYDSVDGRIAQVTAQNLAYGMTWTTGKTIRSDTGATRNSSYYRSTDYIDVSGCTAIVYPRLMSSSGGSNLTYLGAAFYDSSKAFVADSGSPAKLGDYSNWEATTLTVPSGAKYFRMTWLPADNNFNGEEVWVYDADALSGTMAEDVIRVDAENFAVQHSIAAVDKMTAKADHASGSLIVVEGVLYQATEAITTGQTISEHATVTTIETIINALAARVAALEAAAE